MTALMVVATGEIVEMMSVEEASSITTQIAVKLDAIADNYSAVMPLIRDAITRQAHVALGYPSAGAYIADRFGKALSRLGTGARREVVKELSEAGMSTRAIAPVFDVNHSTVVRDLSGGASAPPELESVADGETHDVLDAEVVDDERPLTEAECEALDAASHPEPESVPEVKVTGLDGKQYHRPVPKPKMSKRREKPLAETAKDYGFEIRNQADKIRKLLTHQRYVANEKQVADALRGHLLYVAETVAAVLDQLP